MFELAYLFSKSFDDLYNGVLNMIMPEKIESVMFSPCGINCMVCYRHVKAQKPCMGCLLDDQNKSQHCRKCNIKNCAEETGITYCFNCTRFPCKLIKNLEKSYIKRYKVSLIENSTSVKNRGIDQFLNDEKERWTCSCGGAISLHEAKCSECNGTSYCE